PAGRGDPRGRLPRRDDRPLLHPRVRAPDGAAGPRDVSRVTGESIERVRTTADMVEVVSAHTELRRQGARWTGLCPFHDERTPSFSVDPVEKLYYCFGCQ